MNRKLAAVLASAAIVGSGFGAAIAVAGAQTGGRSDTGATTTTQPATRPDRADRLKGVLDPLVKDGTLTQAQEDKVIAALKSAAPDGFGRPHGGPGMGFGFGMHHDLDAAAKAIGITADQLRTELQGGKSLADVAKAHGVDPATVISALVAANDANLAAAVKAGKLTQAQADQIKANETKRITDRVNGVHPDGDADGPGPHFRGGHDWPGTSTTVPSAN